MSSTVLGLEKAQLDTPALCIDLDVFEANIRHMATTCREHGVDWRPHAKCHKSPDIAQCLVEAGALGVTCAKLGEAEVMAAGGVTDLLIANLIVGRPKLERLVQLCRIADPIVCVDHLDQARPMSECMDVAERKVRVLVEVDLGMQRVGVAPGDEALQLAHAVHQLPGLELAGVMGYEGHLLRIQDAEEKSRRIHEALDQLVATAELLRRNDLPCPIVSCGGTGSFCYSVTHPGITEVQAGGAIFMDEFYRRDCQVADDLGYALTVLATVVSRPAPDRAIIDAGRKTLNQELCVPKVAGRDDIHVVGLSAEHGTLRLDASATDLKIGDQLELIPGYGDLTTVLHDRFHAFRHGKLDAIWPLAARGRLQ